MQSNQKSILVTGGAGFIGSHLCEILVQRGSRVTVVDNLSNGTVKNLQGIAKQVDFHELDILTPAFSNLLRVGHFDVIFHLAANAYVPPSVENPNYDFQNNLVATFQLLETLRCSHQETILLVASSAAVYGNPSRIPIIEMDTVLPISPYGVSKLALERYVYVYSKLYGLRATSLRFFSIYGPRQCKQIIYDQIKKLSGNPDEVEVFGDGTQVRDLLYVEDLAEALLMVSERAPLTGEVYNVASGYGHTTREVVETIARCMDLRPKLNYNGSVRPGDPDKWVASIDCLRELGFSPRIPLEEGIDRTVRWFQAREA